MDPNWIFNLQNSLLSKRIGMPVRETLWQDLFPIKIMEQIKDVENYSGQFYLLF
jgi:hypothetical protein